MYDQSQCGGIRYLSFDDIAILNSTLITTQTPDEPIGIHSEALLASSQQSAAQYKYYNQRTDTDMAELAAVLAASLAQNHAFFNANKRTAVMAALTFLTLNGWECTGPEDELLDLVVKLVNKQITRDDIMEWFRDWCRPFDANLLNDGKNVLR